ncbi:hypothetical protein Ga0074812_103328 [Parafrankia irregularis]|uniref:Uncharacterized protein n=1 Tax=Parafrankia irregularis TaxID=795642 RepID=A0A0S4QK04_9ACTN|nr:MULTISPECIES: hypothetical protein [Parafrankia]CUU54838.1 hypothetical protein Ga0074812_103328 [Parafrankia irregularis]
MGVVLVAHINPSLLLILLPVYGVGLGLVMRRIHPVTHPDP